MNDYSHMLNLNIFVRKGEHILLGKKSDNVKEGTGLFSLPSGVVEDGETICKAILRIVKEHTDLGVKYASAYPAPFGDTPGYYGLPFSVPGVLAVTDHNDINQQQDGKLREVLSFWILAIYDNGTPKVNRPDKWSGWQWCAPCELKALLPATVFNPTDPQFAYTPLPLWQKILKPYFGIL